MKKYQKIVNPQQKMVLSALSGWLKNFQKRFCSDPRPRDYDYVGQELSPRQY